MTIACSNCHKDNPDGSKFCTACGQRLGADPLTANALSAAPRRAGGLGKGVIGGILGALAVTAIGSGAWYYSQKAEETSAPAATTAAPSATPASTGEAEIKPEAPPRQESKPAPKHAEKKLADAAPAQPAAPAPCKNCGVIESVEQITKPGEASGLGAVAGGVLGGVLGNQIGKGHGRDLATVAGVAGGAYAGHQVEKSQRKSTYYEISVRFNDGTRQVFKQDAPPSWRQGDPVRVDNGMIVAR